ncbi:MAG: hypothetical protein IKD44_07290 [Lentisphaeria bacterium]|nr:hypothetical protein [Lentisphaeria bacterium]
MKISCRSCFAAGVLILSCCGCGLLLPEGEPPRGAIVDNPLPEKLTREEMILSLGSRIAASAMEHFPGGPVAIEGEGAALPVARAAIREARSICGVRFEQVAAAVLHGRKVNDTTFEFELFHFSRSMWRCSYTLK